jgi:hypothetical protein
MVIVKNVIFVNVIVNLNSHFAHQNFASFTRILNSNFMVKRQWEGGLG